jgi:FkbM family methyltransferase
MFIKNTIRRLLPPSITIRLIADTNYKSGEPELRLLDDLVDPQRNSIDIGANKGSYTYFLSKLSQRVFAYEPNPELAKFLSKAFAKSNVSIYPVAISDRAGMAQLAIPIVDTFAYDQLGSLQLQNSSENLQTFDVPLQRLDDCGHTNIGFIKIDVEGHEETVIDGAIETIANQRPVLIVEIEQKHHVDKDITEIFSKILALGYDGFFWFKGELRNLSEFSKDKYQDLNNYQGLESLGQTYVCNFIFKPHQH